MLKRFRVLFTLAMIACASRNALAEEHPQTDTAQVLATWEDLDETVLASLFATGESRLEDLVNICNGKDQELHAKAYLVLYLIGSPEARACASGLQYDNQPAVFAAGDMLSEEDFAKLEKLFAIKRQRQQPTCNEDDVPVVDESLSYALVLDGSPRSIHLLRNMAAQFKTCDAEGLITSEIAVHADALQREARTLARDIAIDSDAFESRIRHSAFFIPAEFRTDASVQLLARNETNSRMLMEVSYRCGMLCGSGYYVVLKKNSAGTWDYVLITRAWIS